MPPFGEGEPIGPEYNGSTTTFARGPWPPRVINLDYDGGPKGKITVPGRVAGGHWVNTDPSLKQSYPKLRPHFKALVEPNDKSLLGCEVVAPTNGWQ